MSQSLCFNDFTFSPVIHDNQPWIPARQLANALGYKDERSVHKIYERNKDEFSSMMSTVVNLTTGVMELPTRIFSLRGCHLLAMFARTPVAKAFRRWVLDVIEQYGDRVPAEQPVTLSTPSTPADRKPLRSLVNAWAKLANIHQSTLWPQVRAHFQLERIDDLPVEWLPDALAWVQGKIDELSRVPEVKVLSCEARLAQLDAQLDALRKHVEKERSDIYSGLLTILDPRIYGFEVWDRCHEALWPMLDSCLVTPWGNKMHDPVRFVRFIIQMHGNHTGAINAR
ncbi:Bro-N domain-containing protein [Bilophila wadsworthia]|uniref:Bro-N domain-containing protein n=1 Tax=Bilophila wadsworthia TaxID=35833 RepID=UPI0034CF259F